MGDTVTAVALAERSGVARQTISKILNERTDADEETLAALAKALGVAAPGLAALVEPPVRTDRVMRVSEPTHLGDEETGREAAGGDEEMMSPGHRAGAASQLPADDILRLLQHDRPGFVRFLQRSWASPLVTTAARLQFLDFVEEMARERGVPVPTAYLAHLRGLIAEHGL